MAPPMNPQKQMFSLTSQQLLRTGSYFINLGSASCFTTSENPLLSSCAESLNRVCLVYKLEEVTAEKNATVDYYFTLQKIAPGFIEVSGIE